MRGIATLYFSISCFLVSAQQTMARIDEVIGDIGEVRIEGSFLDVIVNGGESSSIKGIIQGNGDEGIYSFDQRIINNTLILKIVYNRSMDHIDRKITASKIDLTLKNDINILIINSTGNVKVNEIINRSTEIVTTTGSIELNNLSSNTTVRTEKGPIIATLLKGGLSAVSQESSIEVDHFEGNMNAKSETDAITLSNCNGTFDLQTTIGNVSLSKVHGSVNAIATEGNIIGKKVTIEKDISLRTTSGDILIDFKNEIEDLSFFLNSLTGYMEVEKKKYEESLVIDRGGFKIIAITKEGNQKYY